MDARSGEREREGGKREKWEERKTVNRSFVRQLENSIELSCPLSSPFDLASPALALTRPLVLFPIIPIPLVSSYAPVSSSASPNAIRFCNLRNSVMAYASFALRALGRRAGGETKGHQSQSCPPGTQTLNNRRPHSPCRSLRTHRLPPRLFFFCSSGLGNALTTFLGAGLANRSNSLSNLSTISSPNCPSG